MATCATSFGAYLPDSEPHWHNYLKHLYRGGAFNRGGDDGNRHLFWLRRRGKDDKKCRVVDVGQERFAVKSVDCDSVAAYVCVDDPKGMLM